MPTIYRHIPPFCSGEIQSTVEFTTHAELMAIPFVKNFSSWPNFYRYSKTKTKMMAEYDGGKTCYVVGTLIDINNVDLPIWVPVEE
jgi:hypothetical protein